MKDHHCIHTQKVPHTHHAKVEASTMTKGKPDGHPLKERMSAIWFSLPSLTHLEQPHPCNAGVKSLSNGYNTADALPQREPKTQTPSGLFSCPLTNRALATACNHHASLTCCSQLQRTKRGCRSAPQILPWVGGPQYGTCLPVQVLLVQVSLLGPCLDFLARERASLRHRAQRASWPAALANPKET